MEPTTLLLKMSAHISYSGKSLVFLFFMTFGYPIEKLTVFYVINN